MTKVRNRKRRSEKLTPEEHEAFKSYVRSFQTKYDAHLALNISLNTVDSVLLKGSGKPGTIDKIREKINPVEEANEEETEPEKTKAIA